MIKKVFIFSIFVCLFVSCKKNAEIIFWDYSEDLCKLDLNHEYDVNQLKNDNSVITSIDFKEFEAFDSVKKVFKFKDNKGTERLFNIFCEKYDSNKIPYYYFSIVSSGKIIMHGLSRPFAHDVEKYENDDLVIPRLVIDCKNDLRLVYDQSIQSTGKGIEIIHTEQIEKLLPDCSHVIPSDFKIIEDDGDYYFISNDKNTVISLGFDSNTIKAFEIQNPRIYTEVNEVVNEEYVIGVNLPKYRQFSYVVEKQKNESDMATYTDISWNNGKRHRMMLYQNGDCKIEE